MSSTSTIGQPERDLKPAGAAKRRLPSLDGWRAVSILMVLSTHSLFVPHHPAFLNVLERYVPGDLGVRFFFIISGLLITWLLIGEHDSAGKVSLRHFYIRRALRILPVYFAFLGVLLTLHWVTPFTQSRANWIANLTFTTNMIEPSWTSGHLWSLSVEEQFYILWPVLFVGGKLAGNPRLALRLLSVPLIVAPIWRVISYKEFYPPGLKIAFTHFSFGNYFDSLAVGCLCAFLLAYYRASLESRLVNRPAIAAMIGVTLIFLPDLLGRSLLPGRILVALKSTFQAGGFALLLLQSILLPRWGAYFPLNWRWVRHLGVLSYSIYIWQQLFCTQPAVFGMAPVWWVSFPWWMFSAIAVAHLSYYVLERPLFRMRSRFR